MTDIEGVAMKCSNSKCNCQTLNKFGAFIALNSNLRLITFNLKFIGKDIWWFFIEMTDIGTVAIKCSNSKCNCQTLNKFGAFIALNSNLRLITFNLKFIGKDIWWFFIEMTDIVQLH